MKLNILTIASGSSGNSMLIQLGKYNLLVDAGISCKKIKDALNVNELDFNDIDCVFVTHSHADHVCGLKTVSKYIEVPVYGTTQTQDELNGLISKTIEYDETLEVLPELFVTSFYTPHDCNGSCGFIFKYKDIKVGYATDLGIVDDTIIEYLKGSTLVVLESNHNVKMLKRGPYPAILKKRILSNYGHLSNDVCAKTINELIKYGTKHFMLAHLSKENNTPELAYKECHDLVNDEQVDIKVLPVYSSELIKY